MLVNSSTEHSLRAKWKAKYGFVQFGDQKLLYRKRDESLFLQGGNLNLEKLIRVVFVEEVFQILYDTHVEICHAKRVKMEKSLNMKYANIPRSVIEGFLQFCAPCIQGTKRLSKREGIKPIITNGFNKRGQVDLIDFQTHPD